MGIMKAHRTGLRGKGALTTGCRGCCGAQGQERPGTGTPADLRESWTLRSASNHSPAIWGLSAARPLGFSNSKVRMSSVYAGPERLYSNSEGSFRSSVQPGPFKHAQRVASHGTARALLGTSPVDGRGGGSQRLED